MFKLSPESIDKIAKTFPKIKPDIYLLINKQIDDKLYHSKRLKGQSDEYLGTTGLCAEISYRILPFINTEYNVNVISGFFKLDKHPNVKSNKICAGHYWLEIDDKILDFTANPFAPYVNIHLPEVMICQKPNEYYLHNPELENPFQPGKGFKQVLYNDEFTMNWYIEQL